MKKRPVCFLLPTLLFGMLLSASAETLVERSVEARFQIDLKVPEAALKLFLPEGWTLNVATQGPAKDANLRLIFTDRLSINGPEGKPLGKGSNRIAYLAAPAKDASGNNVQLMIGGITGDPDDAPGPFGAYLPASRQDVHRTSTSDSAGLTIDTQDWIFEAKSGEHLEMHIKFEKAVGNRTNPADAKFYSAKNPTFYQISHQQQVLDILKNVTTNPPDRVKEFSLKAQGGSYAKLFDGTEKVLSWDNILWIDRSVSTP
ncbi:MAG: hypothetical protein JWM43_3633 [Acidobacteriaceae bacterium]|nr:hypothetical protein [Acidobacteriaceae bacterium]